MKKKDRIFRFVIPMSLFVILVLTACGNNSETSTDNDEDVTESTEEDEEDEIRVAYSAQPPMLDPQENVTIASSDIMRHVFESLVTVDSEYNIQPMLADSFEQSEDGTEIEFQLREGILFHNGEEMTGEDVEASMNKWIDSAGSREQFHENAHAEAIDDYTVVLHLQDPLSTALPLMAFNSSGFPAIMPKEIVEDVDSGGVTEYVGTGPFEFVESQPDQYVHLSKYDDYQTRDEPADGLAGKREALVDDIYFEFVLDSSTRVSGIQTGEYDIAHTIPYDSVDQLISDPNIDHLNYPSSILTIHFNKREGFFTDQAPRQALAASINNEAIMTAAYTSEDYYDLNNEIMMYYQEDWTSDIGTDIYNQNDPGNMEEYLSAIDYNGEEITIIVSRDYEDHYNAAVVLQEQMEQMGMNVQLEVYDWPTLLDLREDESAYDIFIVGNVAIPEPTSNGFLDSTYPGWAEAPDIVEEIRESSSPEEGIELYDELMEWYWEYVPVVQVGDFNRVSAMRTSIENFQYQDGFILWNVSKNDQ